MPWTNDFERLPDHDKVGRRCIECDHAAAYVRIATNTESGARDLQYRCTSHQARWCHEHGFPFPKLCTQGRSQ